MRKSILFMLVMLFPAAAFSQVEYDTLSVTQIGDGIYHYVIEAPSVPWTINVVEVDINKSGTKLETVKGQDRFGGYEVVSSMSKRKSKPGHEVIAAINGDFYSGGTPTNAQVIDGEIIKGPISRDVFGYTEGKKMFINPTNYEGKLHIGNNVYDIDGVNTTRSTDKLIYYNHFYGASTQTNQYGTELLMTAIDEWVVNGEVRAVVKGKSSSGNTAMTDSTFVLSGHGTSKTLLDGVSIGDTLVVEHRLTPGFDNIKELVGGRGKFLENGVNKGDWPERHPRSGLGFNADTTKFYLMSVDGRQATSAGMTLTEMGEFMKTFGVTDALNLDGGGSTTLVVHNKVVNDPSGGGSERAVANGLLIVSNKQKTGVIEHLDMTPAFDKLYRGASLSFTVKGSDANYYPIELDTSKIDFSLSTGFNASVTKQGKFTAGAVPDTGFVFVEYEGIRDTARIIIKGITDFNLFPKTAVTDSSLGITYYNKSSDFDGKSHYVSNGSVSWMVEDPAVGEISTDGVFKGKMNGETAVIGTFDGVSDTVQVAVEIGENAQLLDSFESLDNWTLNGKNIDLSKSSISLSDSISTQGSHSVRIDYEFVYNNNPNTWVYLERDIPLFGVPDSLIFDLVSNGKKHLLEFGLSDNNEEVYYVRVKKWADNENFTVYPALTKDALAQKASSHFFYPITIKYIGIKLSSTQINGQTYSGTLFIDNLRLTYPSGSTVGNEEENSLDIPKEISLEQNYPNPFNPTTNISFNLPKAQKVSLKVFDILGREVMTLANERMQAGTHTMKFDASNLSSGIYLYRLSTDKMNISKKMTLIK